MSHNPGQKFRLGSRSILFWLIDGQIVMAPSMSSVGSRVDSRSHVYQRPRRCDHLREGQSLAEFIFKPGRLPALKRNSGHNLFSRKMLQRHSDPEVVHEMRNFTAVFSAKYCDVGF